MRFKTRVARVLGEMHERGRNNAYVLREAQDGYLLALHEFERLLAVRPRRRGTQQTQRGGDGSTMIQAGGTITMADRFDQGKIPYDPALDWPDRYPDGGR